MSGAQEDHAGGDGGAGGCLFCAIAAGASPAEIVAEDDDTVAFLDIAPLTRGHTLVIPRRHADDIWDVDADDAAAVMRTARRVARMLRAAFDPPGLNLFQATRALAGQTVFHLHVHVLPRYDASELRVEIGGARGADADLSEVAAVVRAGGR